MGDANLFEGFWYHTQDKRILDMILADGWRPDLYNGVRFGTGVYLARGKWQHTATHAICCRLNLSDSECMTCFKSSGFGEGNKQSQLKGYIKEQNISSGFSTRSGKDLTNIKIRDMFINNGIKAIVFYEYDSTEIAIVYDPTVIEDARMVEWNEDNQAFVEVSTGEDCNTGGCCGD